MEKPENQSQTATRSHEKKKKQKKKRNENQEWNQIYRKRWRGVGRRGSTKVEGAIDFGIPMTWTRLEVDSATTLEFLMVWHQPVTQWTGTIKSPTNRA